MRRLMYPPRRKYLVRPVSEEYPFERLKGIARNLTGYWVETKGLYTHVYIRKEEPKCTSSQSMTSNETKKDSSST